ncbi:unnamed protein product [Rotaria sordida]|uniref:Uncharacterized protein n=2 Tax=Rotaria sordida TaxID=392033 RepID=A0A816DXQ7_9BILA|nr:unnamed protein product [Rotaria sordida]CAF1642720.1 unnamed protein product [Rotaria sordida]
MKKLLFLLVVCLLISITESNRHRRQYNSYRHIQQYGDQYGLYGPGGQGWVNNYNNRYPNPNYAWNTNYNWNQGHRRPECQLKSNAL